jgi:formylglycine-generating enzyme required for sulfatase activity
MGQSSFRALVFTSAALCIGSISCDPSPKTEKSNELTFQQQNSSSGTFETVTKSGVAVVFLPGGSFSMGSDRDSQDEAPSHKVILKSFLIDQFEVYHELFTKAELPNPSRWQDDPRKPVEQVRWRDAKLYCNERSLMEELQPCYDEDKPGWPCDFSKNGYRLPTEAEWEYAARAGNNSPYEFGAVGKLKSFAWFSENSKKRTHVIGTRKPNSWEIHDLYGNVSEWCQDVYEPDYYSHSPEENPKGPGSTPENPRRVMRGGSWKVSDSMCRVSFRVGQPTGDSDACFFTDFCGFRCVRSINPEEARQLQSAAP